MSTYDAPTLRGAVLALMVALLVFAVPGCSSHTELDGQWTAHEAIGPSAPDPEGLTLTIEGDSAHGSDSCAIITATVDVVDRRVTMTITGVTANGCVGADQGKITWYQSFLSTPSTYRVNDGQLTLTTDDGRTIVYRRN